MVDKFVVYTKEFYQYQKSLSIQVFLLMTICVIIAWILTQIVIQKGIKETLRRKYLLISLIPQDIALSCAKVRTAFLRV